MSCLVTFNTCNIDNETIKEKTVVVLVCYMSIETLEACLQPYTIDTEKNTMTNSFMIGINRAVVIEVFTTNH